jgi:hypothetical protein
VQTPQIDVPELSFSVPDARIVTDAAVPTLAFRLKLGGRADDDIRSVVLAVQLRIVTAQRSYDMPTRGRLAELFDERMQAPAARGLLWTHASLVVRPFKHETEIEMPVACTYDMEIATAKYFHALDEGKVPLEFLFSGSVFYADASGILRTCRIGWDRQAPFALPLSLWKEMMERYYPDTVWLRLDRGTFDRLHAWKSRQALPTWQSTVDALLLAAEGAPQP